MSGQRAETRTPTPRAPPTHLLLIPQNLSLSLSFSLSKQSVDFSHLARALAGASADAHTARGAPFTPWATEDVIRLDSAGGDPPAAAPPGAAQRAAWRAAGLRAVGGGRVAVVVLAGGQGTRLGSAAPKGCYDIGLPSGVSLYGLLAARVLKLRRLAAGKGGDDGHQAGAPGRSEEGGTEGGRHLPLAPLTLYVMTSRATHAATVAHFAAAANFGLGPRGVAFVCQGELPVTGAPGTAAAGRVLLATPSTLARAPDGNGGLYGALARSGALGRMQGDGVAVVDVVCVDNALAAPGDPTFLGACLSSTPAFAVGCRALRRGSPAEKVGVFARDAGGALRVLEYSELSADDAAATVERAAGSGGEGDRAGRDLRYGWANICMHAFSLPFLLSTAASFEGRALYHAATKPVPTVEGPTPATKLELFIFDAFDAAPPGSVVVAGVDRAAAFAPVKAATGTDTPADARAAVLARGAAWVRAAGGRVATPPGVEVGPAVSLDGEGLEEVAGREVVEEGDALLGGVNDA